jgi:hypothetical protein
MDGRWRKVMKFLDIRAVQGKHTLRAIVMMRPRNRQRVVLEKLLPSLRWSKDVPIGAHKIGAHCGMNV